MFSFKARSSNTNYEFYFGGHIVTWTESHGFKLNPTKTRAMMLIATQNTRARINLPTLTPLTLNGTQINYTDTQ
jgi:hypothetical protein